jgi:hypothetical protein
VSLMFVSVLQAIIDWGEVGATAVSAVGVLIVVQLLTWLMPILRERYPWAIPLIATLGPYGLGLLSQYLLGVFGYPVDFGPILEVLGGAGALAVVTHQVYKQSNKGRR